MQPEYQIRYRNKYGVQLIDKTDIAKNLGEAQDTARRRLFDPESISINESHFLPTAYEIWRLIEDSELKR